MFQFNENGLSLFYCSYYRYTTKLYKPKGVSSSKNNIFKILIEMAILEFSKFFKTKPLKAKTFETKKEIKISFDRRKASVIHI